MAGRIKKGCNSFDDMNCSKPKALSCRSYNGKQRDLTLNALVSNYIEKPRNEMKRYLRYYVQHTLKDAIEIAALSVTTLWKTSWTPKENNTVCT